MKDAEVDEMLARVARVPRAPNAVLLGRIADSLKPTLRPVRPVAPSWLLASGLVLICVAVAVAAARGATYGLDKLTVSERFLVFPILGLLTWVIARELVSFLTPGSRHHFTAGTLLTIVSLTLLVLFTLLVHPYRIEPYATAGVICLRIGLLHAVPVAILGWLLLRRGFVVNVVATGIVWGTLAGLAGFAAVVLRCDNFEALHVLLWHVGVVPVSALVGAVTGWVITRIRWGGYAVERF